MNVNYDFPQNPSSQQYGPNNPQQPAPPQVKPVELKTVLTVISLKLEKLKAKKEKEIEKLKKELEQYARKGETASARSTMENILQDEDFIFSYNLLISIIKRSIPRINAMLNPKNIPVDIQSNIDSLIFASTRVEIDEFTNLRELFTNIYGEYYLEGVETNVEQSKANKDLQVFLGFEAKPSAIIRLRINDFCKQKNIPFTDEVDFDAIQEGINNLEQNTTNPYGHQTSFPIETNPNQINNDNPFMAPQQDNDNPFNSQNRMPSSNQPSNDLKVTGQAFNQENPFNNNNPNLGTNNVNNQVQQQNQSCPTNEEEDPFASCHLGPSFIKKSDNPFN